MPPTALRGQPDLEQHLGFILSEEEALKKWFTGITVPTRPGTPGTTEVGVWFRYPEGERQLKYPFIVIDMLTLEPDFDLFTSTFFQDPRNLYVPSVSPSLPDLPDQSYVYSIREYLPFRIVWQVSTYARSALHDRYLTSIFTTDVLPVRPFFIHNPADDVMRRTDRVGFQAADTLESTESGTKRIFRKIYTLSMLTDIPQNTFTDDGFYGYKALRVLIPVVAREQFDSYFAQILDGHPSDAFTQDEREAAGEYFRLVNEGAEVPSA